MRQFLIDLIAFILIAVYCTSILGCASIANNRNLNSAVAPICIIPIVNTAYMVYRWEDCKWIELFEECKTNTLKGIDNL